jgi:hypothetical protein
MNADMKSQAVLATGGATLRNITHAALFLASSHSNFGNAIMLPVEGGNSIRF